MKKLVLVLGAGPRNMAKPRLAPGERSYEPEYIRNGREPFGFAQGRRWGTGQYVVRTVSLYRLLRRELEDDAETVGTTATCAIKVPLVVEDHGATARTVITAEGVQHRVFPCANGLWR